MATAVMLPVASLAATDDDGMISKIMGIMHNGKPYLRFGDSLYSVDNDRQDRIPLSEVFELEGDVWIKYEHSFLNRRLKAREGWGG
jgi:hypothetical protein